MIGDFNGPGYDPNEEMRRAIAAERFINDPMFQEAEKAIREGLASQRASVPMSETRMHTRLILAEQLWQQFVDYFRLAAQTGELAKFEVKRQETARERMRRMLAGEPREF